MSRSTRGHVAVVVLAAISSPGWAQEQAPSMGSVHGLHASAASLPGATGKPSGGAATLVTDEGPQSTLYGLSHAEKSELRRQILDAGRELYTRPTADPLLSIPAPALP